jgi:predicted outer membrane repeat protein
MQTVAVRAGTFTLAQAGSNENKSLDGDLDILDDLVLNGSGADTAIIDGNDLDRVFHLPNSGAVTITGVTIQNGSTTKDGGAILTSGSTSLTLRDVELTSNDAEDGGAIFTGNNVTMERVTISGNTATQYGGGIANVNGTVTLENVTISGNAATTNGGAIYNFGNSGTATLDATNVTIKDNTSVGPIAGIKQATVSGVSTVTLQNTILDNVGDNGDGSFTSNGGNIDVGGTAGVPGANTSPANRGPLQNNGVRRGRTRCWPAALRTITA